MLLTAHSTKIICYNPIADRLRLVDGTNRYEGRVEVYHDGVWGTVCDDMWSTNDAKVVCRDLGFPYGEAQAKTGAFFGQGSGTVWQDDVACDGSENRLFYCGHSGWGVHNCRNYKGAGVVCTDGT